MRITDIRATTVTVPLEAPLRHANGCHWGRFVRTIVEVETDNGLIGLGEMGGGGESAEAVFRAMKSYLVGHDPARLEEMRFLIANPTASLYNNRTQVLAALEFACLDILGQAWGVPVCDILGGRLRDRVPFASYCFFRYADPRTGEGEVRTIDQMVEHARALKRSYGFTTHKLKAGVFHPDYELEAYRALAAAFPGRSPALRPERRLVHRAGHPLRAGDRGPAQRLPGRPRFGLNGMRRTREMVRVPLATNTVVVNFEQLAANVLDTAVDVILLDTTFWGGIRACVKAAGVCETFQLGVAVHSSGEFGIQLATMLHLGAVFRISRSPPTRTIIIWRTTLFEGGPMRYEERRDRGAGRAGSGRASSTAKNCANTANSTGGWATIPTIRTRRGPAGRRWFRTTAGPIRGTAGAVEIPSNAELLDLTDRVAVVIGGTSGLGRRLRSDWRSTAPTWCRAAAAGAGREAAGNGGARPGRCSPANVTTGSRSMRCATPCWSISAVSTFW